MDDFLMNMGLTEDLSRLFIGYVKIQERFLLLQSGEMAEWSIAAVLKTVVPARAPGVRIPLSPPKPDK
jgi:hypothetical protein